MAQYSVWLLSLGHTPTDAEAEAIRSRFSGYAEDMDIAVIHPKDQAEHDRICADAEREGRRPIVLLPPEGPIVARALNRGISHLVVVDGRLMIVESVEAKVRGFDLGPYRD